MQNKQIEVECPCCATRLTVDVLSRAVLRAVAPAEVDETGKAQLDPRRWDDARSRVEGRKDSAESKLDQAMARELRAAGVRAEVYLGTSGMKAQMKYADRRGAPAAVILGGDEIAAGQVTIKDLDAGRALAAGIADNEAWKAERPGQVVVPRTDLVATVRRIVDAPHTDA